MSKIKKITAIFLFILFFVPIFWNSESYAFLDTGWEPGEAARKYEEASEAEKVAAENFCKSCKAQGKQCEIKVRWETNLLGQPVPKLDLRCQLLPGDQQQIELSELEAELSARKPILEIKIPGLNFSNVMSSTDDTGTYFHIPWIPELISALYKFGIAIVSIVAVVVIIIQGMRVVTSAGGEAKQSAYKKILQSVIGLGIAWGSFAILYNVNPNLVQFNPLRVQVVKRIELSTENSGNVITDADMAAPREGTNGVPLFKQGDFANTPYGKCGTVKSSGCGPSSMAMVMKYYGADVDPAKVATLFAEEGYRACPTNNCDDCTGTKWSAFTKSSLLAQYGLKAEEVAGETRMKEILKNNHPLIAAVGPKSKGATSYGTLESFTQGGHFIVITGVDANGNFLINDPAKAITVSKPSDLLAGLKGVWHVYKPGFTSPELISTPEPRGCCNFTDVPNVSNLTNAECLSIPGSTGWAEGACI